MYLVPTSCLEDGMVVLMFFFSSYHWALIIGPKLEVENGRGMRYHSRERFDSHGKWRWINEDVDIPLLPTHMLLVRMVIGKVTNTDRLVQTPHGVPVVQGEKAWNCVMWAKNALMGLKG